MSFQFHVTHHVWNIWHLDQKNIQNITHKEDQQQHKKMINKSIFLARPLVLLSWPCGLRVLWSFSPLVLWSFGPLVPWSSGPQALWSWSGPVVSWSFALLVLWSAGFLWFSLVLSLMLFDAFGPFSCSLLAAVFLHTYNALASVALGPFVHF